MNQQKPESRISSDGQTLQLHSMFHTIQGEGPFAGKPAIFVRLAGCNLQCPGCDTEYTKGRVEMDVGDIVFDIRSNEDAKTTSLVVITGGEPFRQNIWPLCWKLLQEGYHVQIETNGSLPPPKNWPKLPMHGLHVVCSPKTHKLNPKILPFIDAYKYVLDYNDQNEEDGLPNKALQHNATPHVARPHDEFSGVVYLQPMDMSEKYGILKEPTSRLKETSRKVKVNFHNTKNREASVKACLKFGYTLQLQIHKLIGVE